MRVLTVVGARPQFVKAAPVAVALRDAGIEHVLVHTGQHYDAAVSDVFFRDLDIEPPDEKLNVGSGTHGRQTADILVAIEPVLVQRKPDWVLVYGDTNSTLAGALAAAKLNLPVAHVEAGLRSFNRRMPEEINRIAVDRMSTLLLCPSDAAVGHLAREGITSGVHIVGDVMLDALQFAERRALEQSDILPRLSLGAGRYLLATVHRAENTDDSAKLHSLLRAFERVEEPVVFPVHPRTRKLLDAMDYAARSHVQLIEPVGYLDMVMLARSARMILTDSGGLQKEAYWLGVPCVTLREETEWTETVEAGWNVLAGTDSDRIVDLVRGFRPPAARPALYGEPGAAWRIGTLLTGGRP